LIAFLVKTFVNFVVKNIFFDKIFVFLRFYSNSKQMSSTANNNALTKSKERIQKHGEVFTPDFVVRQMLDNLPENIWESGKTFLEPACGEGAFLKEIYKRKLKNIPSQISQQDWEFRAAIETSAIYGIELLYDNAQLCHQNLFHILRDFYREKFETTQDKDFLLSINFLLEKNIVQGNALTHRHCTNECGNSCKKCAPIILSQWLPEDDYKIIRKNFKYAQETDNNPKSMFENIDEYNKEYKPVYFKKIYEQN